MAFFLSKSGRKQKRVYIFCLGSYCSNPDTALTRPRFGIAIAISRVHTRGSCAALGKLMKKKTWSKIRFSFSSNTVLSTSSSALRHIKHASKIENCSIERSRCRDLIVFVFTNMKKFLRFDGICFVTMGKFILFLFKLAVIGGWA